MYSCMLVDDDVLICGPYLVVFDGTDFDNLLT